MNQLKKIFHRFCKKKLLLLFGTAFVVFCLTAIFITINKISPKEIRSIAMRELQKTFPAADIKLGKIDFSLGFTVSLKFDGLSVALKQAGEKLFSVKDASIHIPLRAVLFGGGAVEAVFLRPKIFYKEIRNSNNWALAMKSSLNSPQRRPKPSKVKSSEDDSFTMMVPGALGRIKLNFKFIDVDLSYSRKNKQKGSIKFSRFLIKDINFDEKTAFEMASRMNFDLDEEKSIALDALIIGEFNLAEIYKNERFNSFIVVKLGNFKTKGILLRPPEIRVEINLTADKKGKILAELLANLSSKSKFSADFNVDVKKIKISNISMDIYMEDILSSVDMQEHSLSPGKARLNLTGFVSINSLDKFRINPKLKFSLTPGLIYNVNDLSLKTAMSGMFVKDRFHMDIKNQLAQGNLDISVKGKIDLGRRPVFKKSNPLSVKMKLDGLVLKEDLVKKALYSRKNTQSPALTDSDKESEKKIQVKKREPSLIPARIDIDWKKIKLGREISSGSGVVVLTSRTVTTPKMNVRFLKGRINLSHKSEFLKNSDRHSFNLKLRKLDISRINDLLPSPLQKIDGHLNGNLSGKITLLKKGGMDYKVKTDVIANNGAVRGLKLGEKLDRFVAKLGKIPGLEGKIKKDKKYDLDAFKTLQIKGDFSSQAYRVKRIRYVESKNKLEMDIDGVVYPPVVKKQGSLNVNFNSKIANISGIVKKQTNLDSIPVRLKGKGFDLEPDYGYTAKKLLSSMAKSKAKSQIRKLGDKLLKKKGKNKIKDLLKGLL